MQVRRQRRSTTSAPSRLFRHRRPGRLAVVGIATLAVVSSGAAYGSTRVFGSHQVGSVYAAGLQVSADQIVKPLGDRVFTKYGKFMASTPSPDGRFLAVTSTDKSIVLRAVRKVVPSTDRSGAGDPAAGAR